MDQVTRLWVWGALGFCAIAIQTGKGVIAERSYDAGFGKVELLGVCRASEIEISCWNGDGKPALDLEAELKATFLTSDSTSVPTRYGWKTRIAVFRFTRESYDDPRGYIYPYLNSAQSGFTWPDHSSYQAPYSVIRSATIFAKPNEMTAQVTTSIVRKVPASEPLPAKEGAKIDYLGSTYAIQKILKTALDPVVYGREGAGRWLIGMTAGSKGGAPARVFWTAVGKDGLRIRAVDAVGNPVAVDPDYFAMLQGQDRQQATSKIRLFEAKFEPAPYNEPRVAEDWSLYTNINPAKIKALYATGNSSEKLTITGIPLEPAR